MKSQRQRYKAAALTMQYGTKPMPKHWYERLMMPTKLFEMVVLPDAVDGPIEHHFFETEFQARVWSAADEGHFMCRLWLETPEDTAQDIYVWHN